MKEKLKTKYYKSPKATSGRVTVPMKIGDILGWSHKEILEMAIKEIDGYQGLFLFVHKIESVEEANQLFFSLIYDLEKDIRLFLIEKGLIEKEKNNYSISQYISLLADGEYLDAKDIDSLNEIIKFRNSLIHNSPNPSLEEYLDLVDKLELIDPKIIGLILDEQEKKKK